MPPENPTTKRRRGGQPGNKNAKGNRGNPNPRRNFGNCGGKGAPAGNQYALKKRGSPVAALLAEYKREPQALAWLIEHAEELREIVAGESRDPVLFGAYSGLTPEALAERGCEYRYGLFNAPSLIADEEN